MYTTAPGLAHAVLLNLDGDSSEITYLVNGAGDSGDIQVATNTLDGEGSNLGIYRCEIDRYICVSGSECKAAQ